MCEVLEMCDEGDGCCLCGMSADEGLEIQHWSINTYLCLRLILSVHVTPGTQSSVSPEICQVWPPKNVQKETRRNSARGLEPWKLVMGLGPQCSTCTTHNLGSCV